MYHVDVQKRALDAPKKTTLTLFHPFHFDEIFRSMKLLAQNHYTEAKILSFFPDYCPASFSRDFQTDELNTKSVHVFKY